MKHRKLVLLSLLLVICLTFVSCSKKTDDGPDTEDFDAFTLELFKEYVSSDALTLHYSLKNPETYDISLDEITLGRLDYSTLEDDYASETKLLADLRSFDYSTLTDEQKRTYDILESYIENDLLIFDSFFLQEVLDPTSGIQTQLPVLMAEYTFYDESDVTDYIALLHDILPYFESVMDFQREKSSRGYFMTDSVAASIIEQCQKFIASPEANLLLELFEDKLDDELAQLDTEKKEAFIQQNHDAVMNSVIPAYEVLIEGLSELQGTGTNKGGLTYFEGGETYYQSLVRYKTGSAKTPAQLIEMVEESLYESLMAFTLIYLDTPDIYERLVSIEYNYTEPTAIIEHLKTAMLEHFPELPEVSYSVKYVHESLQDDISPAFYLTPPLDDISSHVIYVNGGSRYNMDEIFPTIAHEGYPGHLYQTAYFYNTNPSEIRSALNFGGYVEGWATYIEGMSYAYAGLDDDISQVMAANLSLSLGIYARIDLGIHHEGWYLEEVAAFLTDYGFDASIADEIYDTILAAPASYLSYCIGALEFSSLRDIAEKDLDESFDEIEFHRFLLEFGPAQFDIIEKYMQQWILEQK